MLFLLKRTWLPALLAGVFLALVGLGLRPIVPAPTPFDFSWPHVELGVVVWACVLTSDAVIHGVLLFVFRDAYRRRHRELSGFFRDQRTSAILAGALMAGVGEELVFRGLSLDPVALGFSAVAFGLLHHIRLELWSITIWSMWQGVLFALALTWTGSLCVTMTAHFLHDASGFLLFRWLNRTWYSDAQL
jgi:membrane protease YdiL (CAAX protease family)